MKGNRECSYACQVTVWFLGLKWLWIKSSGVQYHSNDSYWAARSCGAVSVSLLYKVVLSFDSVDYFSVVLFIVLRKVVLTFESLDVWPFKWKLLSSTFLWCCLLYKVVLTFASVDEILKCDHSNESYWAVLPCDAVYYVVQYGSIFWFCRWNPKVLPFKWKLLSSTFTWCCLLGWICRIRWF